MKFTDTNVYAELDSKILTETAKESKGFATVQQIKSLISNEAEDSVFSRLQESKYLLYGNSYNGNELILVGAQQQERIKIYPHSTFSFLGNVVARKTNGDSATWHIAGVCNREQEVYSVQVQFQSGFKDGLPDFQITKDGSTNNWRCMLRADTVNGGLDVIVIGGEDQIIDWRARITTNEILDYDIVMPNNLLPIMWLDASKKDSMRDLMGIVVPTGGRVSQWMDQSSFGNSAYLSSFTTAPTRVFNPRTEKSELAFDGINNGFVHNLSLGANHTVFIVLNSFDDSGTAIFNEPVFFSSLDENGTPLIRLGDLKTGSMQWGFWRESFYGSGGNASQDTYHLICFSSDGTEAYTATDSLGIYQSYVDEIKYSTGRGIGFDGNESNFSKSNICEIIVFDLVLNPEERAKVNEYLNKKWTLY